MQLSDDSPPMCIGCVSLIAAGPLNFGSPSPRFVPQRVEHLGEHARIASQLVIEDLNAKLRHLPLGGTVAGCIAVGRRDHLEGDAVDRDRREHDTGWALGSGSRPYGD